MNLPKIEPITWKGVRVEVKEPMQPRRSLPIKLQAYVDVWNIAELSDFFKGITLPTESIRLNQCETIKDVQRFIDKSLALVTANNGKRSREACMNRLKALREYITTNLN